MNQERLIWQGQKQEKELESKRLKTSINGLINSVRTELNPHTPIEEINQELVWEQAFEMADKLTRYKQLCAEIKNINQSLGIV